MTQRTSASIKLRALVAAGRNAERLHRRGSPGQMCRSWSATILVEILPIEPATWQADMYACIIQRDWQIDRLSYRPVCSGLPKVMGVTSRPPTATGPTRCATILTRATPRDQSQGRTCDRGRLRQSDQDMPNGTRLVVERAFICILQLR